MLLPERVTIAFAAAGKLGALQNLLNYSKFAWGRTKFVQCPTVAAAFHGHVECLEVLLAAGLFEDLQLAMSYAQQQGQTAAYQAINYFISTNDSSIYFSACDESFDTSVDSLRASFGNLNISNTSGDLNASSAVSSTNDLVASVVKANGTPHVEQLNA